MTEKKFFFQKNCDGFVEIARVAVLFCPITLVYQIILQDGINLQAGHFLRLTAGLFDWL